MGAGRSFIPFELIILLFLLGIASFIFGFRKFASTCVLLAVGPVFVPEVKDILLSIVPWWAAILLSIIFSVLMFKVAISFIFGKNVADQAIGQLTATFSQKALGVPYRAIKILRIKHVLYLISEMFGKAILLMLKKVKGASSFLLGIRNNRNNSCTLGQKCMEGDLVTGTLVQIDKSGYLIDVGDGFKAKADVTDNDWMQNDSRALGLAAMGDEIEGVVLRILEEEKILYIRMQQLQGNGKMEVASHNEASK